MVCENYNAEMSIKSAISPFNFSQTIFCWVYDWDLAASSPDVKLVNVLADVNLGKEMFDEIKILHNKLKVEILPKIAEYGIMSV